MDDKEKGYWEEHQKEWVASGLSKAAYCRKVSVNYDRFRHGIKKAFQTERKSTTKLIPIQVTNKAEKIKEYCIIEYSQGIRIQIQSQEALQMLPKLIRIKI